MKEDKEKEKGRWKRRDRRTERKEGNGIGQTMEARREGERSELGQKERNDERIGERGREKKHTKELTWLVPIAEKYVANPSFSQMSSHQLTETMLPNQKWASS
jgi:hypothetical protein